MQNGLRSLSLRIATLLERLPAERRRELARAATLRARALGLVVVREAGDIDIPLTLTPELATPEVLARRGRDAAAILEGVLATARLLFTREPARAALLFGHFGPLEAVGVREWKRAEDVTIARVDWFLDEAGDHHALELNATIPAMEAYSDAAARAWIETVGALAGLTPQETTALVLRNGSNAEELRRSILAHAGRRADERPSIAILHRPADSQVRELEALARAFAAAGHDTRLATPDAVTLAGDGTVLVHGAAPEILYRHIFARRIPEGTALERIARGEGRQRLQNPVNGHLEVKGLFAELSRRIDEGGADALGLDTPTRESLARVLPWTRLVERGAGTTPEGPATDLVAWLVAHGERLVLKRSWDYGGKSVHIGSDVVAREGRAGWEARVEAALADAPGSWVVQQLISSPRRPHLVVGHDGETQAEEVFVDASTYTASGSVAVPTGSVVRFARVGVVNIVGGGGVSPLVRSDVAEELAAALEKAPTV